MYVNKLTQPYVWKWFGKNSVRAKVKSFVWGCSLSIFFLYESLNQNSFQNFEYLFTKADLIKIQKGWESN